MSGDKRLKTFAVFCGWQGSFQSGLQSHQLFQFFRLAFPDHDRAPAEFAQRALMQHVAGGVAVEFFQPPFAPVRGRGAVLTAPMPMPETAVHKNRNALPDQDNVRRDETTLRWLRVFG